MASACVHVVVFPALAGEVQRVAQQLGLAVRLSTLTETLTEHPADLRRRLQTLIDEVSASGSVSQIVIVCGRRGHATVGLHARHVPLTLPRVHDDMAGFVAAAPDDAPTPPAPEAASTDPVDLGPAGADVESVLENWRRYYQRLPFLDANAPEHRRHVETARRLAAQYGWSHEPAASCSHQLRKLMTAQRSDADVLWVPPHHVTGDDPRQDGLQATPIWKLGHEQDEVIEIGVADDSASPARLGLGIDAGGTYTDVVIYDFAADDVVQKAKALTTKWDYTLGICSALDQLDAARLRQVDLVCVSTTLATNAVVEGRGQKVGLLIMPPYGLFADDDISHRPIAVIQGQMEIDGSVRSPIDPQEVARVARQMVEQQRVGAFAVAGFASHVNPDHEAQVRQILEAQTGLPVTCGHDVSEQLDYRVRAQTAALNGRIIPILAAFLRQAWASLQARGINAPVMVVRSDGSLMSAAAAQSRPIQTILSGPAASVAGARHLARVTSAYVVDVGGTTTDTALIAGGVVRTARHGARVGHWQTHVQALDLRTCGLGGDSLIAAAGGQLHIGPRRVGPIAWLGARGQDLEPAYRWIDQHMDRFAVLPELMDLYTLNSGTAPPDLSPHEQRILEALAQRPHSGHELAGSVLEHWWQSLDLERLESMHLVQRCGLTLTDVLHADGRFVRWNVAAAQRMLGVMSQGLGITTQQLGQRVMEQFVRRLALEVLKMQVDQESRADRLDESEPGRVLVENWLRGGSSDYHVQVRLKHPIVGIGAPVTHVLPQAADLLQTRAIVPEHADVANALGAITSSVVIQRQVEICPDMQGRYGVYGMPEAPTFAELHEARAAAMRYLQHYVGAAALAAGTRHQRIRFTVHDKVAPLSDGGMVFIAQTIEARLTGRPDLAR
jgi:N-methylhydantoinase A/oxoprolinase/acetone carboxylase beta subunit